MSTPAQEDAAVSIVRTDGVLDGKPRLEGHRISVLDVTELLEAGHSVRQTAALLDITPEEVRAAARYFRHHRRELVELQRRRRAKHEELRRSGPDPSA